MDEETKKIIEALEAKIAALEAKSNHRWEVVKDNITTLANNVETNRVSGLDLSAKIWGEEAYPVVPGGTKCGMPV